MEFWLPNDVMVTLGWNGRTLRNKHVYSDFLVSNVDASQKIGKPKEAEKTAEVPVPNIAAIAYTRYPHSRILS